jgi:hypothetical protein
MTLPILFTILSEGISLTSSPGRYWMVITSFTAELLKLLLVRNHDSTMRLYPLPPQLACHPLQLPATYNNYTYKTHTSFVPCGNYFWTA